MLSALADKGLHTTHREGQGEGNAMCLSVPY